MREHLRLGSFQASGTQPQPCPVHTHTLLLGAKIVNASSSGTVRPAACGRYTVVLGCVGMGHSGECLCMRAVTATNSSKSFSATLHPYLDCCEQGGQLGALREGLSNALELGLLQLATAHCSQGACQKHECKGTLHGDGCG